MEILISGRDLRNHKDHQWESYLSEWYPHGSQLHDEWNDNCWNGFDRDHDLDYYYDEDSNDDDIDLSREGESWTG